MGPVLAQLRRDLRTQWRSLLALAVLVGLIGGVVLASTMAARRTASAYTRYVDFAHAASDVQPSKMGCCGSPKIACRWSHVHRCS